ncbi:MAG TPA: SOS response-associated peptidase [Oculatellaceae cyanobacterium]
MCGRYTIAHNTDDILSRFEAVLNAASGLASGSSSDQGDNPPLPERANYNVAPTVAVPIILRPKSKDGDLGARTLLAAKWGLLPSWIKDIKKTKPFINARAETLLESRMFKSPYKKHRCIIPADSFYEWQRTEDSKVPMRILMKDRGLFGFAGIWEEWRGPENEKIRSCSIITVTANKLVQPVHDRMPAILPREFESLWLDTTKFDPEELAKILAPYPEELMELYPVSNLVNSVKNNSPELIVPRDASGEGAQEQACQTQLQIPFN